MGHEGRGAPTPARSQPTHLDRAPGIARQWRKRTRYADLLRLVPYLKPYRVRWVSLFLVALLGTLTTIVIPLITKAVIDGPIAHRDQHRLWTLGTAAVAVGVLEAVAVFTRRYLMARATLGVETDIRKDLYARLQLLPMSFHGKWQSGQLVSRIMNDLGTVRRFISFGLIFLVLNFVQIVIITVILLFMYWPLGAVVVVSTVPITLTVLHYEHQFTRLSRAAQDRAGQVATQVEESALGLRVIKSFGREAYLYERFDQEIVRLNELEIGKVKVRSRFWTLLEVIPNLTLIVVLGLGALAASQGHLTLGTLVAFITLMLSLVWPISSLGFLLSMTQESMTAADRVAEVFDSPLEITDGGTPATSRPAGHLQLLDVGFRFPDTPADAPWALRHVDLELQPGETVAVVGATGSGKSILTELIPRLFDVTEGRILLDGQDVRDIPTADLRRVVATAFEDPTLFSMSVRENVTLGRPEATDEQVRAAIQVAQAQFVEDLPYGLDTRIGEQGMSLSGGQRQRLSLARAVLSAPKVLVLDDTLSALDVHTEALVEEALGRVLSDVTGIVVAHRASTVLLADRVALLQHGTITHVGTHHELLQAVPAYRYLLAADDELADQGERRSEWSDDLDRQELARRRVVDEAAGARSRPEEDQEAREARQGATR